MVPGDGPLAIIGVDSGSAVALIAGLPGVEVHPPETAGLPSGAIDEVVPVALPSPAVAVGDGGAAVEPAASGAGSVVVIWIGGAEQLILVPGVVGSSASGTGASVVSGTPGWVVAENGPGPLSGDET